MFSFITSGLDYFNSIFAGLLAIEINCLERIQNNLAILVLTVLRKWQLEHVSQLLHCCQYLHKQITKMQHGPFITLMTHYHHTFPQHLTTTSLYAHWDPVRRSCWRFPQKISWLMVIVLPVIRLKVTSVCNSPVNFSCFLKNQPQNQPLCKNHAIIARSRGKIFFFRVNFLCWLLFQYLFHPYVPAVACKRSWSFCQKYRWQVTAEHACILCKWLCMKWCDTVHGCMVYTEHADDSSFTWHQPGNNQTVL